MILDYINKKIRKLLPTTVGGNVKNDTSMRIQSLIIIVFAFLISCSTKQNQGTKDELAFSVIDSLKKYSDFDSISIPFKIQRTGMTIDTTSTRKIDADGNPSYIKFCDTINAILYMGKANNVHFGLILKGGKISFYQ